MYIIVLFLPTNALVYDVPVKLARYVIRSGRKRKSMSVIISVQLVLWDTVFQVSEVTTNLATTLKKNTNADNCVRCPGMTLN